MTFCRMHTGLLHSWQRLVVQTCAAPRHHHCCRYGDLAGIQAAKAKATERGQKVKATRQGNTQRRK